MSSKESRRSIKSAQIKTRIISLLTKVGTNSKTFLDAAVTVADDTIAVPNHGYTTGDRVQLTTTGVLPAGLALATDYWIININSANQVLQVASSLANALAGTPVTITAAAGAGTHTILNTEELNGIDRLRANTVQAQSTGLYRITFDPSVPFGSANDVSAIVTPSTADVVARVKTVTATYIDVEIKENDDAPVVIDGFFHVLIIGSETSNRW